MKKNIPALAQKYMLPTSRYDEERVEYVVQFIGALKHTKGKWEGQPFKLLEWQKEIVHTVFGVIGENGYRQFRTCYIEIPKKAGKTPLAAALALYMLIADGEVGADSGTHTGGRSPLLLKRGRLADFLKSESS